MRNGETLPLAGIGTCFFALDLPGRDAVLKIPRPPHNGASPLEEPLNWRRWRRTIRHALLRHTRIRKANEARDVFEELAATPEVRIPDFFPETQLVRAIDVRFEWKHREREYQGWGYVQRRATMPLDLERRDWSPIIEVQHGLWRWGVGLGSMGETWGPKNWCLTSDGSLRMADLSSLTQRRERVSELLSRRIVEHKRSSMKRGYPQMRHYVDEYLAFLSDHLHEEALEKHWRKAL